MYGAGGRPLRPEPVDPEDPAAHQTHFCQRLTEGPITLCEEGTTASVTDMYKFGTAWLDEPLQSFRWSGGGRRAQTWREVQVSLTCAKGQEGQRLTGGVIVAFTQSPPTACREVPRAQNALGACGFTVMFLPRILSTWSSRSDSASSSPSLPPSPASATTGSFALVEEHTKHNVITVCHGDIIRVLINEDGWLDVVFKEAATREWHHIVGWQTALGNAPLYAGLGIQHTTIAKLLPVRGTAVLHQNGDS